VNAQLSPQKIVSLYAEAQATYPEVVVPRADFERALLAAAAREADWEHLAPDLFLAVAVGQRDEAALKIFDVMLTNLAGAVRRVEPDDAFVSEVMQVLRIKLLVDDGRAAGGITSYRARAPLDKWLRAVAINTALRLRSSRRPHGGNSSTGKLVAKLDSAEVKLLRSLHQRDFEAAFSTALRRLSAQERSVLRLRHIDGLTLEEVAAYLKIDRSTAVRRLAVMRERLTADVRERLATTLKLAQGEIDSLVRAMGSDFRISVGRLLNALEHGARQK
jgi:RNA polymerase sigma-70 factor, ECF subfamily